MMDYKFPLGVEAFLTLTGKQEWLLETIVEILFREI
jgi:hypothetical protein